MEIYTGGFQDTYLYLVYILSIVLGIYIIISKNPVVSVLFLIGLFFSVSLYLIFIGLYFIGLSYLLVYVGAISILFLFILMLINIRVSELLTDNNNSIPLALASVVCFNYTVDNLLPNKTVENSNIDIYVSLLNMKTNDKNLDETTRLIDSMDKQSTMCIDNESWINLIISNTHITSIGNILYTNLFIFFIMISIILLLAMVGAIIITIYRPTKSYGNSLYIPY